MTECVYVLISKMQTMKDTVNTLRWMECGSCVSHLIYLLLNLQYDENMNYDYSLILEKDRKAYNTTGREKERRRGMEDGVFFMSHVTRNSKFEQHVPLLFSKPDKNQRIKCIRMLRINQNKCIIYTTQNAQKIVIFIIIKNGTLRD